MKCGPELAGQIALGRDHVDGDDPPGTGNGRAIDRRQANAATADDRHGLARPHIGGVDGCTNPGHHRTADQGGAVEGHILTDRDAGVLMDQHEFGEGGQVQILHHRASGGGQTRLIIWATLSLGRHAERQVSGQAGLAVTAEGRKAGDDVVAHLHRTNFDPDRLNHAGTLVPQHGGQWVGVGAFHEV